MWDALTLFGIPTPLQHKYDDHVNKLSINQCNFIFFYQTHVEWQHINQKKLEVKFTLQSVTRLIHQQSVAQTQDSIQFLFGALLIQCMTIYFHSIKTLAELCVVNHLEPCVDIGGEQQRIVQKPHLFQSMHAWHGMAQVVVSNEFQNSPKFFLMSQDV